MARNAHTSCSTDGAALLLLRRARVEQAMPRPQDGTVLLFFGADELKKEMGMVQYR
jgi:hypothetical protein